MDTDKNLDYYIYRLLDRDTRPTIIMGLYQEQFFFKKRNICSWNDPKKTNDLTIF